jgi:NAD(P)-dependent dehydrogenase (short-subunit alcohol dehydrogenase family)
VSSRGNLLGRTALITGAARGIGAETARRLVALGANVMLVGLEPERLAALTDELGSARAAWAEADVVDHHALAQAVETAMSRFGRLDIAIANAGLHFVGAVATAPQRQLERELLVNLHGTLLTDRAVLPALTESRGYLLNIASLAAATHLPLMGAYSASKAGIEALTNCLRSEIAYTGVDVGCAYLGFFDTDLVRGSFAHRSSAELIETVPAAIIRPRPIEVAVDAIVDGVLARKKRVWAPRFVGPVLALRGILQPIVDYRHTRSRAVAAAARLAPTDHTMRSEREILLGVAAEACSPRDEATTDSRSPAFGPDATGLRDDRLSPP